MGGSTEGRGGRKAVLDRLRDELERRGAGFQRGVSRSPSGADDVSGQADVQVQAGVPAAADVHGRAGRVASTPSECFAAPSVSPCTETAAAFRVPTVSESCYADLSEVDQCSRSDSCSDASSAGCDACCAQGGARGAPGATGVPDAGVDPVPHGAVHGHPSRSRAARAVAGGVPAAAAGGAALAAADDAPAGVAAGGSALGRRGAARGAALGARAERAPAERAALERARLERAPAERAPLERGSAERAPAECAPAAAVGWHELEHQLGGWPVGALVGLSGVGRTRVAMAALAAVAGTRGGEHFDPLADGLGELAGPVAWVDAAARLFPPSVARLGVDLARLLWVRPRGLGDALWATHVLLASGGFGRVVLDLPGDRVDRRVERAVLRLERDAEAAATSGFLLAPEPLPGVTLSVVCREDAGSLRVSWRSRRGPGRRLGELTLLPGGRRTAAR